MPAKKSIAKTRLRIAVVGDYDTGKPSHPATNDAIAHTAAALEANVTVDWIPTPSLAAGSMARLSKYAGLWASSGSPYRSEAGILNAIRYAREHGVPLMGT